MLTILHELPIDTTVASIPCSLITSGFLPVVLHSDQPLSEGDNPVQRCLPVRGGLHYPRRRRSGSFTHWRRLLWCATDDDSGNIIPRASFSALASTNSFVYFASSAATSRWRIYMSVIAAFASFSSLAFCLSGFVGNGVITVMINSPWQADDDADNQSGDNRGDSAHTSISLTERASLNFAIRLSALCSNWHNQRGSEARYCCNGRLPDGYHHDQS